MRSQLGSLQAVRGVACLLVWGVHLASWEAFFGIARPLCAPLLRFGFGGVDLFFVLSGFIITHTQGKNAGRPAAVPGYLFRRFWRVYPAFWAVFGLAFAVGAWGFGTKYVAVDGSPARWLEWLALWPTTSIDTVLPNAWTLGFEVLFYAAFALVLLLPRGVGATLLFVWGLVSAGAAVWGSDVRGSGGLAWHLFSPLVWEFLIGCGVAWAVRRVTRFGWAAAGGGVVWGTVAVLLVSSRTDPNSWAMNEWLRVVVFGLPAGLVVYGLAAAELRTGFTPPRWLRWVGDASYSVYLWHVPAGWAVFHLTTQWPHTMLPHVGWLLLMTVVGVGGGLLFHRLVERPILGLVKGRKPKEAPTAGEVVATTFPVSTATPLPAAPASVS